MRFNRIIPLFLFLTGFGLASCKKSNVTPQGKDLVLTPAEQQKVTADNAFTIKLFKNLSGSNTSGANLFVSPLSVSFAIAMTANGANGQTLADINSTMNFTGFTQDQVNNYYNKMITELPQLDPNTTLDIANSIWYKQGFTVQSQFLQANTSSYHAKSAALDFSNPSSVSTINNWVSSATRGNIPTIIQQIPADALMYLVNAIYFKSGWKEKFNAANTNKQDFYLENNSTVSANFMSNDKLDFKRYDAVEGSVFELPYSNNKYSMVIVLPAAGTSVSQLVAGLDSTKWKTWMAGLNYAEGPFKMPKFKFSYGTSLVGPLTTLGMGNAFTDAADFSRINSTVKPLFITDVEHKAFVDVDENGTTAAAVTVVVMGTTASAGPIPVVINRPFLFAIRQMSSGLILFAGTVNNPLLTGN